ncbi:MAG TPA: hypothetical protein VI423_08650, partial [Paenisporosarcina sp.]|nr:hypothetical protein [Paenisporosarcina sp.]
MTEINPTAFRIGKAHARIGHGWGGAAIGQGRRPVTRFKWRLIFPLGVIELLHCRFDPAHFLIARTPAQASIASPMNGKATMYANPSRGAATSSEKCFMNTAILFT